MNTTAPTRSGRRFDDDLVGRIKAQIDPVQLIGKYVDLKATGASHTGLCPFHEDKKPSFEVYSEGNYKCWSCGASGGDVLKFLKDHQNIDFPAALEIAAEEAGIPLTRDSNLSEDERIQWQVLQETAEWYQGSIRYFSDHAMGYIKSRHLTPESVKRHRLGYAAKKSDNLKALVKRHGLEPFLALGLIRKSRDRDDTYAFMRDRLVIPVLNSAGNVISLVGRAISDEAKVKYLTLNTPFFERSKAIYGWHMVTNPAGSISMAEGPLDAIMTNQQLGCQAVAPMGTSVTDEQIRQIISRCSSLEVLVDGDPAGRKAAVEVARLIVAHISNPVDVGFRVFPEDEDPGSWLPGRNNLDDIKRKPLDEVLVCAARHKFDLESWFGQSQAAAWLAETMPAPPAGPVVEVLRHRLAGAIGVPASALQCKPEADG